MYRHLNRLILSLFLFLGGFSISLIKGQELNCTVKVNHSQIQGTSAGVFESLETAISEFMNNRSWTDLQFQKAERIDCNLNITVKKYNASTNAFSCELLFQVTRPVFNSGYNTVVFSMRDTEFTFSYQEQDALEFNENNLDNNLTAMLAYYAYLFIGMDLDTFSPMGGTEVLHVVESIVNSAQSMSEPGWKAFDKTNNRHAIINDYMDSSMEPFRLQKRFLDYQVNIGNRIIELLTSGDPEDQVKAAEVSAPKKQFQDMIDELFADTNKKIDRKSNEIQFMQKMGQGCEVITPYQLSSGEKQMLAILLTVLVENREPYALLMDEPEISLHIDWQQRLIDLIRQLNPNAQIILSTHYPALIMDGWMSNVTEVGDISN